MPILQRHYIVRRVYGWISQDCLIWRGEPFYFCVSANRSPESILSVPAPDPKPYPLGPYFLPWHVLQKRTFSWQLIFVESSILLHILHLKHSLWNWSSPTALASAAYTDLLHLGHFMLSGALNGISVVFGLTLIRQH